MQAPLKKKSDMKLLILYLMKNIGYPLDFSMLNDVASIDGLLSGFDFAECFSELLDAGNIKEIKADGSDLYALTGRGQNIVDALDSTLIPSIRESALKSAMRLLSFRRNGSVTEHRIETDEHGNKSFVCSVADENGVRFALRLAVDSPELLDRMQYNFNRRPEKIYKAVYALLSGDMNFVVE